MVTPAAFVRFARSAGAGAATGRVGRRTTCTSRLRATNPPTAWDVLGSAPTIGVHDCVRSSTSLDGPLSGTQRPRATGIRGASGRRRPEQQPALTARHFSTRPWPHGAGEPGFSDRRGRFAVISPDGHGRFLPLHSGAGGQINDLANMQYVAKATRRGCASSHTRCSPRREHGRPGDAAPRRPSPAAAEGARRSMRRPISPGATGTSRGFRVAATCRSWRAALGGTPDSHPGRVRASAASAIAHTRAIAFSQVPLQLYWSVADEVVLDQQYHSARLFRRISELNPRRARHCRHGRGPLGRNAAFAAPRASRLRPAPGWGRVTPMPPFPQRYNDGFRGWPVRPHDRQHPRHPRPASRSRAGRDLPPGRHCRSRRPPRAGRLAGRTHRVYAIEGGVVEQATSSGRVRQRPRRLRLRTRRRPRRARRARPPRQLIGGPPGLVASPSDRSGSPGGGRLLFNPSARPESSSCSPTSRHP